MMKALMPTAISSSNVDPEPMALKMLVKDGRWMSAGDMSPKPSSIHHGDMMPSNAAVMVRPLNIYICAHPMKKTMA